MSRDASPALPPGFKSYRLAFDWGRMHLVAGGQGEPLFMVHGLGGSCHDFLAMAPELARDHTLLIPDLPGFGYSDKPDLPYSPEFFAQVMTQTSERLGLKRAHWLGHSMGGQIAFTLGLERPELVRSVVAVCPAGGQDGANGWQSFLQNVVATKDDRFLFFCPCLVNLATRMCYGDPNHPSRAELTRRVRAQWEGPERPLLERSLVRSGRAILEQPVWPRLGKLQPPVLLVQGERDRVVAAVELQRIYSHLPPGARWEALPCGHMPVYTMAPELSAMVRGFLRGLA
ncbi:MAG: alpha/beta fold hydrolase [Desulfarculus sp.]|nr:alpha/beta fold hydrolase [Pseudomonadota bacterium]MBV1718300.1 alpha/beta fold hydrolase [Desulfarculus sp.]MBU4575615.1 alpha/beta fold hydrolase [Pseudomonadota bacterium]MBU4597859.1 alpha/beta fold hydrolase [Pseudomonadota bacterium]MBV1738072.1 alpha/beta fold hydrolase [Desulfarculus sp.]